MPVYGDCPVVSLGVWQSEQPIDENRAAPFCVDDVAGAGVGGAERRANNAKLTASEDISEAVPVLLPPSLSMCVLSSGVLLNTQPGTALLVGEQLVRDAHLHVVCLSGKDKQ
jgi:hypothetical protein